MPSRGNSLGHANRATFATVLSVAMLLAHLGYAQESLRVEQAVADDLAERGSAARSTSQIGDAIAGRL